MRGDLPATVERVAAFLGIPLSPELRAKVIHQSSLPFMKAHGHKFDDHLLKGRRNGPMGLPPGGEGGKVGKGSAGEGAAHLDEATRQVLEAHWQEIITPVTGFEEYAALRRALGA